MSTGESVSLRIGDEAASLRVGSQPSAATQQLHDSGSDDRDRPADPRPDRDRHRRRARHVPPTSWRAPTRSRTLSSTGSPMPPGPSRCSAVMARTPIVAICGVLHAGLIGAPIDAREPAERLQPPDRRERRPAGGHGARARRARARSRRERRGSSCVDDVGSYGTSAPHVEIPDEHPGLVLFTSGSTGIPKGVVGGHRDIVPRSVRMGVRNGVGLDERHALTTSFGFSAAEGRIFEVFLSGATVCTYDLRTRGPGGLPDWVRDERINVVSFVPSTLRALADDIPPGWMDCVQKVGFGSETLFFRDVRIARPLFGPHTTSAELARVDRGGLAHALRHPTGGRRSGGPGSGGQGRRRRRRYASSTRTTSRCRTAKSAGWSCCGGAASPSATGTIPSSRGDTSSPSPTAGAASGRPTPVAGGRTGCSSTSAGWTRASRCTARWSPPARWRSRSSRCPTSPMPPSSRSPVPDGGTRLVAYVVARRGAALSSLETSP